MVFALTAQTKTTKNHTQMHQIITAVSTVTGLAEADILRHTRQDTIQDAKSIAVAIAIARGVYYKAIADHFGRPDHTFTHYQIKRYMRLNKRLKPILEKAEELLPAFEGYRKYQFS